MLLCSPINKRFRVTHAVFATFTSFRFQVYCAGERVFPLCASGFPATAGEFAKTLHHCFDLRAQRCVLCTAYCVHILLKYKRLLLIRGSLSLTPFSRLSRVCISMRTVQVKGYFPCVVQVFAASPGEVGKMLQHCVDVRAQCCCVPISLARH